MLSGFKCDERIVPADVYFCFLFTWVCFHVSNVCESHTCTYILSVVEAKGTYGCVWLEVWLFEKSRLDENIYYSIRRHKERTE